MAEQTRLDSLISWPLLPVPDDQGYMRFPSLEKSVRQSIQIILRTRPGERLMRAEFGGGLEQMLNEQNTLAVRRDIKDLVTESLERWEPRMLVDRVEVWELEDEPTKIRIEIGYRLRRTGATQQMGITMELES